MRRFLALSRTAILETFARPLTAILFLTAFAGVHLAPAFHFHQFGESARLARECGFSCLLVFGILFATGAAAESIGSELENGTAATALTRDVSRPLFLIGRLTGVFAALVLFAGAILFATALACVSARVGAHLAQETGESPVWGPGVAAGVGGTLLAFAAAAALNRFRRFRFCLWACLLTAAAQPLAACAGFGSGLGAALVRLAPALAVLLAGCIAFVALAGALAVRLPRAAVSAGVWLAVVLAFLAPVTFLVPDIARFWLVDELANGGTVSYAAAGRAFAIAAALVTLWLSIGAVLLERREIP